MGAYHLSVLRIHCILRNDEWWMMNDEWWMMNDEWEWWMMNDEWWMMNEFKKNQ